MTSITNLATSRNVDLFNRASLSDQVEEALREEIILGHLKPGQRFSVADYQDRWNISVTPFRDAVRNLELQGFVIVEPRKGAYVAPIDKRMVQEIFELRIALECMAIELATAKVPVEEALRVREAYLEAEKHARAGDPSLLGVHDRRVHDLGRDHCDNERLRKMLSAHMNLIRWLQNTIIKEMPSSYELALPEHIAIMNAVCDRDPERAARSMRQHLENSRARLESQLASHATPPKP